MKFVNRYTTTPQMLREYFWKYLIGPRPVATIFMASFLLIVFLTSYADGTLGRYGLMLVLLTVFFAAIQSMPIVYASRTIRNTKAMNRGKIPETVVTFTNSEITVKEGENKMTLSYKQLKKTAKLHHSYVLFTDRRRGILIRVDGFQEGNFQDFQLFLRARCPGVKVC